MERKTYAAREGSHITDADAQRVGECLAYKFGDQRVLPSDFVRVARPKGSPVHGDLEWDDTVAGEQWRLEQARKIIGALVVVRKRDDGTEQKQRAYHSVVVSTGGVQQRAYVPEHVVWRNVDLRVQVLRAAAQDAERAARRLDELNEAAEEAEAFRGLAESLREKIAA